MEILLQYKKTKNVKVSDSSVFTELTGIEMCG